MRTLPGSIGRSASLRSGSVLWISMVMSYPEEHPARAGRKCGAARQAPERCRSTAQRRHFGDIRWVAVVESIEYINASSQRLVCRALMSDRWLFAWLFVLAI